MSWTEVVVQIRRAHVHPNGAFNETVAQTSVDTEPSMRNEGCC